MSTLQLPLPSSFASPLSSGLLGGGFIESQKAGLEQNLNPGSVHSPVGDLAGLTSLKLSDLDPGGRSHTTITISELTLHSDHGFGHINPFGAWHTEKHQVGNQQTLFIE